VIFVTVGTQLPFDRMVAAVDAWAAVAPGRRVFAQVGPTDLRPRHIDYKAFVSPAECHERMVGAEAIVAHAGMGTILRALELGKPLLVVPRRAALGEHRNDHQLATARRFAESGKVAIAFDDGEIPVRLDELGRLAAGKRIGPYAPESLIAALRRFIDGAPDAQTRVRIQGRHSCRPGRRGRAATLRNQPR
jgi:UDP-N-acetylglucosamine transferase subunit ALG13